MTTGADRLAAYGGDAGNAAVTTACGEANEITQVAEVAGSVVSPPTTAVPAIAAGDAVRPPGGVLPRTGATERTLVTLGGLLLALGRLGQAADDIAQRATSRSRRCASRSSTSAATWG